MSVSRSPKIEASYMTINEGLDVMNTYTIRDDVLVDVSGMGLIVGVGRIGGPVDADTLAVVLFKIRVEGVV